MPVFKNANAKEFKVQLDAPTIRDVRKECDIDLGAADGSAFATLESDPVKLVDVLWVVCRAQAGGMTDEDFGRALVGDPLGEATKALTDAWLDFFPAGKRSLLRSLSEKQAAVTDKATALAMARLTDPKVEEQLLAAMTERIDREMREHLTRLRGATNSLESSESAPLDSPPPSC